MEVGAIHFPGGSSAFSFQVIFVASGSKIVAIGSGCKGFCRRKKRKAREIANEWIEWMKVLDGFLQSGFSMHLACSHGLEGSIIHEVHLGSKI